MDMMLIVGLARPKLTPEQRNTLTDVSAQI